MPLVIAHRGDSSAALENSRQAISLALDHGVDMIELDIRKTADNALFVMHDATTGRTAREDRRVETSTAAELSGVRLRNGESVPSLQDVLGFVAGRAGLNLEIKSTGAGQLVAREIAALRYTGYVLISSFHEQEVEGARSVLPRVPTSLIFDSLSARSVPAYRTKGHGIVSLKKSTVDARLIAACRSEGVKVYVWTIDAEKEMNAFIDLGVDGIYSNDPGLLRAVCDRRRADSVSP